MADEVFQHYPQIEGGIVLVMVPAVVCWRVRTPNVSDIVFSDAAGGDYASAGPAWDAF